MSVLRKAARAKERKDIKDRYGKSTHQISNCLNCGAALNYGETDYESVYKCPYCKTEYHIDRLGKVEEYKVKIQVMGEIREFYVDTISMENQILCIERYIDGYPNRKCSIQEGILTLTLKSYR